MAVTMIAARLLEMYCSAHATETVPQNNVSIPATELTPMDFTEGKDSRFTRHQPHNKVPAKRKRNADNRKGGID